MLTAGLPPSAGTMIPRSGGDFAYIHESFGPLPAFLFLWVALLIIMPTGNAIQALTFAYYMLQPFYSTCHPPDLLVRLVAAMVICEYPTNSSCSVFKVCLF